MLDAAELVPLQDRRTVAAAGHALTHVYFPTSSLLSLALPLERGQLEVGMVGREGFFGIPVALGQATSGIEAVAQNEGNALRISAAAFRAQLRQDGKLRALVD